MKRYCLLTAISLFLLFSHATFAENTYNASQYTPLTADVKNTYGLVTTTDESHGLHIERTFGKTAPEAFYELPGFEPLPFLLPSVYTANGTDQSPTLFYGNGHLYLPKALLPPERSDFPARFSTFDAADIDRFVRGQGAASTCWAYSANTMMELYFYNTAKTFVDLSEDHMLEHAPVPTTAYSGGHFNTAIAYWLNGSGPVEASTYNTAPIAAVDSYKRLTTHDAIRAHIEQYGAAVTSIYFDPTTEAYYDADSQSYYNPSTNNPVTHNLLLVGWDDYFPKERFQKKPKNNGAYLALNSFGSGWGDKGLFYISYEDVHVRNEVYGIDSALLNPPREKRYYYNDKGVTHYDGLTGADTGVITMVLDPKTSAETLTALGLYAAEKGTTVSLYLGNTLPTATFFQTATPLETVELHAGYQKVALKQPVQLTASPVYISAVYRSQTPFQLPIQAPYPGIDYTLTADAQKTYIGGWTPRFELYDAAVFRKDASVALRAYTQ
ncbi:C1 family peptidase [Fusibacter sp. JL298sf-3]